MNLTLRSLAFLIALLRFTTWPIFRYIIGRRKEHVSPIRNDLLTLSATKLAEKIRQKEVTSEEICRIYIARIKEVNRILNAVVEERFENALIEARNVDIYLKVCPLSNEELMKTKPLLGVPLTVKESCSVAGMSHCVGTLGRKGVKAYVDGEAVAKLRASGAIPLLVSNTPEICLNWECSNFITGTTKNPYNTNCTSSGSSGGEGALLGAGASVIGVGSDVAGSIRLPAMFNGVFGHKPTARIISIEGHYPKCNDKKYADYFVIGPMCRYAEDLKLMTKIMSDDPSDLKLDEKVDLSKINIYYMEEEGKSLVVPSVQEDIKRVLHKSVEYLRCKHSCTIQDYKFTDLDECCEIAGSVLYSLRDVPDLLKGENQNLFVEFFKSALKSSKYTYNLLLFYLFQTVFNNFVCNDSYINKNYKLRTEFMKKLETNGVFLYPTFPTSAFKHYTFLFWSFSVSYLMIFNTLGFPATHVPCGFDKNGMPIGIQVVAAPKQDRLCFAVAEELEKLYGGWIPPA